MYSGLTHQLVLSGKNGIVIENCAFRDLNCVAIELSNCHDITIRNCTFENVWAACHARQCGDNIKFLDNACKNMTGGKQVDGSTHHRGQMFQAESCIGSGYEIARNSSIAETGKNHCEDHINFYKSSGTPTHYMEIHDNIIKGFSSSSSGTGILMGDNFGRYQRAYNNKLFNCGQVGIGIAGGSEIEAYGNTIIGDHQGHPKSNVGLYIAKMATHPAPQNCRAMDNHVNWWSFKQNKYNHTYKSPSCPSCVIERTTN